MFPSMPQNMTYEVKTAQEFVDSIVESCTKSSSNNNMNNEKVEKNAFTTATSQVVAPEEEGGGGVTIELQDVVRFPEGRRGRGRRGRGRPIMLSHHNSTTTTTFEDFIHVLTNPGRRITKVICHGHLSLALTEDQWNRTITAFGEMPHLQELEFQGKKVPNAIPLSALAKTLRHQKQQQQFRSLTVGEGVVVHGDTAEYDDFCQALVEGCSTSLQSFVWEGRLRLRRDDVATTWTIASLDRLCTQALAHCHNLVRLCIRTQARVPTSPQAMEEMIQKLAQPPNSSSTSTRSNNGNSGTSLTEVELESSCWGSVASCLLSKMPTNHDESSSDDVNVDVSPSTVKTLCLTTYQVDEQQFQSLVSALKQNQTLEALSLTLRAGFCDSMIQEIAKALDVNAEKNNKNMSSHNNCSGTLKLLTLSDANGHLPRQVSISERGLELGVQLLRNHHGLQLDMTNVSVESISSADTLYILERSIQMENCLNRAGRGRLVQILQQQSSGTIHDWIPVIHNILVLLSCHDDHDDNKTLVDNNNKINNNNNNNNNNKGDEGLVALDSIFEMHLGEVGFVLCGTLSSE
ncbi:hypothetical protein ACA910_008309 [Epithemia clementina (nom. ined.)]